MAELTPLASSQRPTDGAYQPISGFAVAAITVAGIFVLGLVLICYSAFMSNRTPLSYELLFIAVVGVGLAIAAKVHLKRSEGTRTGASLANAGWWICVLGGVGYAAFLYANEYFIARESREFTEKFFEQLQADKPRHAFMYIVEPAQRPAANPDDAAQFESTFAMGFGNFHNNELARLLRRNGKNAELIHASSVDIGQESEGFKATQIYTVRTPEGIFEARVGLKAAEARKGGKPVWRISSSPNMAISLAPKQLSEYGRLMVDMEGEVNALVRDWSQSVTRGMKFRTHVFTLPGQQREEMDSSIIQLGFFGGGPATVWDFRPGFLPPERRQLPEARNTAALAISGSMAAPFANEMDLTGELLAAGFFRKDAAGTPFTPDEMNKLRGHWRRLQLSPWRPEAPAIPDMLPPEATQLKMTDDSITFIIPMDWLPNDTRGMIKATLIVSCTNPEVIRIVNEAKKRGYQAPDNSNLTIRDLPPRAWTINALETDLKVIAPPSQPGAPQR